MLFVKTSAQAKNISNVTASAEGPSPHEDCLAEEVFFVDVRGGVLETEKSETSKTRRSPMVSWLGRLGARPS